MSLEHIVKFRPAYDRRNPDPKRNYGIHCVDMFMIVKGPKGAISFTVFTGWYLPHNQEELRLKGGIDPTGADIGYHSKQPLREWQSIDKPTSKECDWLGCPCWSDGSSLAGHELFKRFVVEGEDIVWKTLEEWYHTEFDSLPDSDHPLLEREGRMEGFQDSL